MTIVYQGEVEHRDSAGNGDLIGPGDVQWMTAGSGLLHEEFHSGTFTRQGGTLEMAQLWVNLPAKDKMTAPRYQAILKADITEVPLAADAGRVRVIAGEYAGKKGPATTYTELNVWDVRLRSGPAVSLPVPAGHNAAIALLRGAVTVNETEKISEVGLVVFERDGHEVRIEAHAEAVVLVLSGVPIEEPIVGRGPFVMNTREEIVAAIRDLQTGSLRAPCLNQYKQAVITPRRD